MEMRGDCHSFPQLPQFCTTADWAALDDKNSHVLLFFPPERKCFSVIILASVTVHKWNKSKNVFTKMCCYFKGAYLQSPSQKQWLQCQKVTKPENLPRGESVRNQLRFLSVNLCGCKQTAEWEQSERVNAAVWPESLFCSFVCMVAWRLVWSNTLRCVSCCVL